MQSRNYNPYLKPWLRPELQNAGGAGEIEKPGHIANVAWQTRSSEPGDYENRLGDALVKIFATGIEDLGGIVRALNELGVLAPDGATWTEPSFQEEIKRLASK